jgi:hypothetical protein
MTGLLRLGVRTDPRADIERAVLARDRLAACLPPTDPAGPSATPTRKGDGEVAGPSASSLFLLLPSTL